MKIVLKNIDEVTIFTHCEEDDAKEKIVLKKKK